MNRDEHRKASFRFVRQRRCLGFVRRAGHVFVLLCGWALSTVDALADPQDASSSSSEQNNAFLGLYAAPGRGDAAVLVHLSDPNVIYETEEVAEGPPCFVLRLKNTSRHQRQQDFPIDTGFIQRVRIGNHYPDTHVVVHLKHRGYRPEVRKAKRGLVILLHEDSKWAARRAKKRSRNAALAKHRPVATQSSNASVHASTQAKVTSSSAESSGAEVDSVDGNGVEGTKAKASGSNAVGVQFGHPKTELSIPGLPEYILDDRADRLWTLRLKNTRLQTAQYRPSQESKATAVRRISVVPNGSDTLVTLSLSAAVEGKIHIDGFGAARQLVWSLVSKDNDNDTELAEVSVQKPERDFDKSSNISEAQVAEGTLPAEATRMVTKTNSEQQHILRRARPGPAAQDPQGAAPTRSKVHAPQRAGWASRHTSVLARTQLSHLSRRRGFSFKSVNADIRYVLRLLAEQFDQNIVASKEVTGAVTLSLKNVPFEEAMDAILRSNGYDWVRRGRVIRVASAQSIQTEREREIRALEQAQKTARTEVEMVPVNYADAKEITKQLREMLTEKGSLQVDERTNTVIIEDVRTNIDTLTGLIRRLDRPTPQVRIEARIVEANTSALHELGIQWGGLSEQTGRSGNPTGLTFPSDLSVAGGADDADNNVETGTRSPAYYAVNLPAAVSAGSGGAIGFSFGNAGLSQLLNLRLSALEEAGQGRVISAPRVTTLDNRQATISEGVDIPVSQVSANGTNTRFVEARLKLEVTPHVTNDGSIYMKITATKAEPDFANRGGQNDPSIRKKEASTEVLVADGETTVIGGIYTRSSSKARNGVPLLSKIPILGFLFRSTQRRETRSEMLIFVTPTIVNRDSALVER